MTKGIYQICLGEKGLFYIGQSLNIEERISQHKSLLKNNRHYNWKMQLAFSTTKELSYTVLEVCSLANTLNAREDYYIKQFNSIDAGYNITSAGTVGSGTQHPSSVYSKEQIIDVMYLCLSPKNTYKEISEATSVSIRTVGHIANREVHYWLEELFPEECIKLVNIRDNKLRKSSLRSLKVYKYTKLVSPEGVIYEIDNISAFGRIHNLDSNKLGDILRGTRKTHKNWKGVE